MSVRQVDLTVERRPRDEGSTPSTAATTPGSSRPPSPSRERSRGRPARGRSSTKPPFAAQPEVVTIPEDLLSKVGEGGSAVRLLSNHFLLKTDKDVLIYDYHVSFEPPVESPRFRRMLVYQQKQFFNDRFIFDGGANVKSLNDVKETFTASGANHNNETVQMTFKPTGTIAWRHPEMMRFYNTQMRRNLTHIGMVPIGRNFFDKSDARFVREHNVEVWPGVLTAINEHDAGILMVVNSLNKIIRRETALEILARLYSSIEKANFRTAARRELAGCIVMTKYNSKTYRIDDVIFDKNPVSFTFEKRGETISLKDYYYDQYQMEINDQRQPLIIVRPTDRQQRGGMKKEIVLIPELCLMTGITDSMKNDMRFRKDVDKHVKLDCVQRMKMLKDFVTKLTTDEKVTGEMNQWKLSLEPAPVMISGRLLPPEKILVSDRSLEDGVMYDQSSGSFEQNIRSERMRYPVDLEYWVIVAPMKDQNTIYEYQDMLKRVAGPLGVRLSAPRYIWLEDDRTSTYIERCRNIPADKVKMVHIIVPNSNRERYNAIKRFFCVDCPCPSQVLTHRVLNKNQMSVVTKLVLQMSVKMGAQAWAIHIPPKETMIVGFNTYRDTSRRGHTVGAFVCSTNAATTTWYSRVDYHRDSEEMACNLALNLKAGMKAWQSINQQFPERIIIYRDGVSEGQIAFIFETEIKKVKEILESTPAAQEIKWTFIVVNKRINARFFMIPTTGPPRNPCPGTIVDSMVTRKAWYDFYLISQSVRFGTVNPTVYNIIYDYSGWKPVHHQTLAYKLCHLYYNWAGTISVPAPCHYAYKLACLIGTCIHTEPSPSLAHKLYFL